MKWKTSQASGCWTQRQVDYSNISYCPGEIFGVIKKNQPVATHALN